MIRCVRPSRSLLTSTFTRLPVSPHGVRVFFFFSSLWFRYPHRSSRESLSAVADRFQALPLNFMRFHGGTDVDSVLDAMDYAVYAKDVQHIILDNLQFMLTRTGGKSGGRAMSWDKFEAQVRPNWFSSEYGFQNCIIRNTAIKVGTPFKLKLAQAGHRTADGD